MTTILGSDVAYDVRRILNDAGSAKFTFAQVLANINAAIREVSRRVPASCYSSPVAFSENITLAATGSGGTAFAATDVIAMSPRWRDAIAHYAAHLCFNQTDRNTVNDEFAARELKLFEECL